MRACEPNDLFNSALTIRCALLGWVACGLVACSSDSDSGAGEIADTIFLGGPILTMDGPSPSYVEAVAVVDGVIVYAGSADRAKAMQGDGSVVRDLQGNALLPGFIDPHGHFIFAINMVNQVNVAIPPVGPVTNIAAVIDALQNFQTQHQVPDGEWIVGYGYDADGLEEGRNITKLDLDPSFPKHKVILIHVSGHGAVLNTLALEAAGIDATTETPPGGVINRLPGSNEPAGLLMETAYAPVFENLPRPSSDELLGLIVDAQRTYASQGYTHAQDGAATHQVSWLDAQRIGCGGQLEGSGSSRRNRTARREPRRNDCRARSLGAGALGRRWLDRLERPAPS